MNRVNIEELEPSEDYLSLTYRNQPFTGIAYEENDAGVLTAEVRYLEGQKAGVAREWSASGTLVKEQSFAFDTLHGPSHEWYENGEPKIDAMYELGVCLSETEWAPDGSVVRDFVLQEGSPQFGTLERLRASSIGQAVSRRA